MEAEGRTAGRAPISRKLRIGQIVNSGHAKSSIPSRFETILFTGARERNAFGRRTHRFDQPDDDLPGPGTYKKSRSLVKASPSLSKKGTGGFASSSKIAANMPRALFITPGPGSYPTSKNGNLSRATPPSDNPSASFARPVSRRAVGVRTASSQVYPGPGEYHTDRDSIHNSSFPLSPRPTAVFGSRTQRDTLPANARAGPGPGPGEYYTPDVAAPNKNGECSAVFKPSNANASSPKKEASSLGELAKTLPQPPPSVLMQPEKPSTSDAGTAPLSVPDKLTAKRNRLKPSSMFASTLQDRFGKPVVRFVPETVEQPGPGQYDLENTQKRLLISSSWAMSGSERFYPAVKEHFKPPGPAFYNPPAEASKQSFHLNNKGTWIT